MTVLRNEYRLFSSEEYAEMARQGFFEGERVELIEGRILKMSPHSPQHRYAIAFLNNFFVKTFGDTHLVQVQLPLSVGSRSEPEPDFSFVTVAQAKEAKRHPTCPDLVIEIAVSSLLFDSTEKAGLYASAKIPEYWILNLEGDCLEVYREPKESSAAPSGWVYGQKQTLVAGEEVTPVILRPAVSVTSLFSWREA